MGNHYEKKLLKEMWFKMNLAREFENRVQWLFSMGLVHGTTHLGVGEEATAVGSILALQPQDYVFGTHRGHSQAISKGIDINHMMAEILAKANGVCKGKGGSMHIADPDIHYFGADGILGTSAVMCCGTALKIKKKKEENRRLNSDKVLFSIARGRERCDRNGHAVFLRPGVDFATTSSETTGISTSSTKLK